MNESRRHEGLWRELGDGLILRQACRTDGAALAEFNARVHDDPRVGVLVSDLMEKGRPGFHPGDFTLVQDVRSGAIVSSLCLISQVWSYGGVPVAVGQPELVGTLPECRRRGLVRAQFEVIHAWSAERGQLMQTIEGIPWYYRRFGYEMGIELFGGRGGFVTHVPDLEPGAPEPYRLRPMRASDIAFVSTVYEKAMKRYLVSFVRDAEFWRYRLLNPSPENCNRSEHLMIETADGEPVGFLAHGSGLDGPRLRLWAYEVESGASWARVTPTVLRYLRAVGEEYAFRGEGPPFGEFELQLGTQHPVYAVCRDRLPALYEPYALYVRVPDLAAFLLHVRSTLERRLAASAMAGYTGELKVSLYQRAVHLTLHEGRLVNAQNGADEGAAAAFPDQTFLQLLFGYRSLEELEYAFADCWVGDGDARALLTALFPKGPSRIWTAV